ncbi:TonB-dependent vitamin B12 receptor [Luteimonas sp. A478]
MQQHILPLSLALAAVLASPAAMAQQDPVHSDPTQLDEVVVTATRTPVALIDSIAPVQVLDREEIERSQARSLPELLRGRAGIDLVNQGGAGKLTTMSIRGTESDHVLVLVDGVRMGTASAGLVMFHDLPVDQIDRIEIVRGPRSSLYGSEALGGVIQIFTRRDSGAVTPRFRAGIGSNSLREASAGIGGGNERGWFGIDAAYQRTDGINSCRGSAELSTGCFADEPDRDGYRNRSISARGGVNLGEALSLEANLLRAEAENEYDGTIFGGNESDNLQQAMGATLTWTPSDQLQLTVQAGRSRDDSDNYFRDGDAPREFVSAFDTRRDSASLQADFIAAAGQTLTAGIDWLEDHLDSTTPYDEGSRDNLGVFAGYEARFGAQRLQASLRHDDNEQFGGHTTGSAGWGMTLESGLRVSAGYATGFRAPSFNELYFPGSSNPDLGPEKSRGVNLGLAQNLGGWHWALDAYQTRIDDMVGYDAGWNLIQADEARIRGGELTLGTRVADWDLAVQLSHVDPRNRSGGALHDNVLTRRARNTGRLDLDRAFGALRFGVTVNAAGSRYDDAANTVRLGGYSTTDLRFEYAINPAWTLQARATNVFDRDYETIAWYNQPGREYGLSLRYSPAR